MVTSLRNLFRPPVFPEDEDKTRKAKYAHVIALGLLGMSIAFEALARSSAGTSRLTNFEFILIGFAALCAMALVLLRKGYVRLTSYLLVALIWLTSNGFATTSYGVRDASFIMNFAIVLMAGLLLGWQASVIFTILSAASGFTLALLEQNGIITVPVYPITFFARDVAFIFGLNGIVIYQLINGLEKALKRSRTNLKELESANTSLSFTQTELQARTADLLTANDQLENRARKLRAVAEVTRTATALQNFDELLASITGIISNQLGYYHVAIFLLDEQRQYAILRSANTEAGASMLARGYNVPVGQLGIVSSVAQSGQPRIALNLGQDARFFDQGDLAEIQSQLALPLKSGNEIIGVLDIQSTAVNDFTENDISTLSILADQVGIALQNALLFEESQRALREANIESGQASRQAWQEYAETISTKGYRYDGIKSEPLKNGNEPRKATDALLIPVQLRGQTIGRLKLNTPDRSHEWTDDELVMVRATAERVALALEGARLLDQAQKRATREAFLSGVATKLSTSFQLDSILRDTVQELGQTLKNSTVTFQLVDPSASAMAPEPRKANGSAAE